MRLLEEQKRIADAEITRIHKQLLPRNTSTAATRHLIPETATIKTGYQRQIASALQNFEIL